MSESELEAELLVSYPIHLDDVHVPVLWLHRLRIQLKDKAETEGNEMIRFLGILLTG